MRASLAVCLLSFGCSADRPSYTEARMSQVKQLARQASHVDTVVLGDSITEQTSLEGACGLTFNAGVGGAKVRHVRRIAEATRHLSPRIIVLAIGTNDLWKDEPANFRSDYRAVVDSVGPKVLVGTPNSEAASAFIRSEAQRISATYIPPVTGKLTSDGVHLTSAGRREYRRRIQDACDKANVLHRPAPATSAQ